MRAIGKRRNETRLAINDHVLGKLQPEMQIGIMVIHRAMMDWHLLIARRAWEQETLAQPNFTELRRFFAGRLCAEICQNCETMTPEHMLDLLEKELADAMGTDCHGGKPPRNDRAKERPPAGERDRQAAR